MKFGSVSHKILTLLYLERREMSAKQIAEKLKINIQDVTSKIVLVLIPEFISKKIINGLSFYYIPESKIKKVVIKLEWTAKKYHNEEKLETDRVSVD